MKDASEENRVMTMEQAREVLVDVIESMLNACDEVRVATSPPDPNSFFNNLISNLSTFLDTPDNLDTSSGGIEEMVNKESERRRSRMPEDWDDWHNRGWLDEDSGRSVSSVCGVNPHCWSGLAMACSICYADAIDEMFMACFPKNNGKDAPRGKVKTRRTAHVSDPFRGPGRPKNPPLVGPPAPPGKPGRPRKYTDNQRRRIKQVQNAARHQGVQRAGPVGNRQNNSWGMFAGRDAPPADHRRR